MASQKTLLLVEDDFILSMHEALQLEKSGYSVVQAHSGEKAIEAARNSQLLDLVLMDIDLGKGMDGTEAAEIILKEQDLPVLFLSSHTESEIVEKTERITNYGYVVKNSSITVLDASIKMALKLFNAQKALEKAYAKLATSEEKFAKIFFTQPDPVTISRIDDGTFIEVNAGFTNVSGFSREETIGKSSFISGLGLWVNMDERIEFKKQMDEKREVNSLEVHLRNKDGEVSTVLLSARPIDIEGESCQLIIAKDITHQKELENAIVESEIRFRTSFENAPIGISLTELDGRMSWQRCPPIVGGMTTQGYVA